MYVIYKGQVDIYVSGKFVDRSGKGSIIGEKSLLHDEPRNAT